MVYLTLLNGRSDPSEDTDGMGFYGPTFPADKVVGHYKSVLKIVYQGELQLFRYYDDMVFYDGCWYGEWEVIADFTGKPSVYNEAKTDFVTLSSHLILGEQ